jgi:hypothetical protein
VEFRAGKYFCVLCGAELDVSEAKSVTTIVGASGKANIRILSVNGKEVHRCEMSSREPLRP